MTVSLSAAEVHRAPKCELHVHVEGSIRPSTLRELSDAHRVAVAGRSSDAQSRFRNLGDFLRVFGDNCRALRSREALVRVSYESAEDAAHNGIRYREVFFSPAGYMGHRLSVDEIFGGLAEGALAAERDFAVRTRWILNVNKALGASHAMDMVEFAVRQDREVLVGIGAGSQAVNFDFASLVPAWKVAARHGLHRTCHAGEDSPAASVWQCVAELGCERVDHGVRAIEDSAVVRRIADRGIPLTVCPSSNVEIAHLVPDIASHPLERLRRAGVLVTVNSDDPAMLGVWLGEEYWRVCRAFTYSTDDLQALSMASIEASWMDSSEKRLMRARFAEEFAAWHAASAADPTQ